MSNSIPAVQLPTLGELLGFPSLTNQSAECSATTNLQTQLAPFIASMTCQLKILQLLKPLIEVVKGLPNPPPQVIQKFLTVADELLPCLLVPDLVSIVPFVRDLLCLEIRSLNCFLANLRTTIALAEGDPSGVSVSQVQTLLDSYPPIVGILNLAAPLFQMAELNIPAAPALGAGTDPGSLQTDQQAVAAFVSTLQPVLDALGGCR